jgi:ribonuclease T2
MIKTLSAAVFAIAAAIAAPSRALDDAGYFLLALTWTPSWCLAGDDPDHPQCDPSRDLGFTLHGLWPQFEDGWPEFCDSDFADPSRRQTAAMADIMGTGDLAWYQWKKHGRCAGLPADAYFAASRRAYSALDLPQPDGPALTADALERAFIAANPALDRDALVVTCRDDRVQEVRLCLDRALAPRTCGPDVLRSACRDRGPLDLPPVR